MSKGGCVIKSQTLIWNGQRYNSRGGGGGSIQKLNDEPLTFIYDYTNATIGHVYTKRRLPTGVDVHRTGVKLWGTLWPAYFDYGDQHNVTCAVCNMVPECFVGRYNTLLGSYSTGTRYSFPVACSIGCQERGDKLHKAGQEEDRRDLSIYQERNATAT